MSEVGIPELNDGLFPMPENQKVPKTISGTIKYPHNVRLAYRYGREKKEPLRWERLSTNGIPAVMFDSTAIDLISQRDGKDGEVSWTSTVNLIGLLPKDWHAQGVFIDKEVRRRAETYHQPSLYIQERGNFILGMEKTLTEKGKITPNTKGGILYVYDYAQLPGNWPEASLDILLTDIIMINVAAEPVICSAIGRSVSEIDLLNLDSHDPLHGRVLLFLRKLVKERREKVRLAIQEGKDFVPIIKEKVTFIKEKDLPPGLPRSN